MLATQGVRRVAALPYESVEGARAAFSAVRQKPAVRRLWLRRLYLPRAISHDEKLLLGARRNGDYLGIASLSAAEIHGAALKPV